MSHCTWQIYVVQLYLWRSWSRRSPWCKWHAVEAACKWPAACIARCIGCFGYGCSHSSLQSSFCRFELVAFEWKSCRPPLLGSGLLPWLSLAFVLEPQALKIEFKFLYRLHIFFVSLACLYRLLYQTYHHHCRRRRRSGLVFVSSWSWSLPRSQQSAGSKLPISKKDRLEFVSVASTDTMSTDTNTTNPYSHVCLRQPLLEVVFVVPFWLWSLSYVVIFLFFIFSFFSLTLLLLTLLLLTLLLLTMLSFFSWLLLLSFPDLTTSSATGGGVPKGSGFTPVAAAGARGLSKKCIGRCIGWKPYR